MHQTTKHITVQSCYVMECVQLGLVLLQYIPTAEQQANIFTKALLGPLFQYHLESLMTSANINKDNAMLAVKIGDVPKPNCVFKFLVTLCTILTLISEGDGAMLIARVSASDQHQGSSFRGMCLKKSARPLFFVLYFREIRNKRSH